MFWIDEQGTINLSVGDTASFTISATGYTFDNDDRALWTVKNNQNKVVFERAYPLVSNDLENGVFQVNLINSDTDMLAPGDYNWDVRYIIHPYYDSKGRIFDGDQVITPKEAQKLKLLPVIGEV